VLFGIYRKVDLFRLSWVKQGSKIARRMARSRQRFAKDIFTTKNAKATKDSESMIINFVLLCLRVFAACANFSRGRLSRMCYPTKDFLTRRSRRTRRSDREEDVESEKNVFSFVFFVCSFVVISIFLFWLWLATLCPPSWSNLWLSAEPLLSPIRYPLSSILGGCGVAALFLCGEYCCIFMLTSACFHA
jgi:hypothetical protein